MGWGFSASFFPVHQYIYINVNGTEVYDARNNVRYHDVAPRHVYVPLSDNCRISHSRGSCVSDLLAVHKTERCFAQRDDTSRYVAHAICERRDIKKAIPEDEEATGVK